MKANELFEDLDLPFHSKLPPFSGATGWLNTEPLTPDDLRGKVVLVDFWTYTCINWIRTLPYIRAWAETYGPHGRFRARDLHLILAPPSDDAPVNFRVWLDGQPPGEAHGLDVDEDGNGVVREARLYQLIRQPGPIDDRVFEIELREPGAAAFCFTFG